MKISKMATNYVLVEAPQQLVEEVNMNGTRLYIDPTYEVQKHALTHGKVVMVPDKLFFSNNPKRADATLEFGTEMELKVGDIAYFHYLQPERAIVEGRVITHEGKRCIIIKYDTIFCAIRDDDFIMVNGWMLVEVEKEGSFKSSILHVPDNHQERKNTLRGTIAHLGTPNYGYKFEKISGESDWGGKDLKKGDKVMFEKFSDIPIEYDMHKTIEGEYYRMQRKDIMGTFTS